MINDRINKTLVNPDVKQLNYFFDYERWNDAMNHTKPMKAKADIKKKKKKVLKF